MASEKRHVHRRNEEAHRRDVDDSDDYKTRKMIRIMHLLYKAVERSSSGNGTSFLTVPLLQSIDTEVHSNSKPPSVSIVEK